MMLPNIWQPRIVTLLDGGKSNLLKSRKRVFAEILDSKLSCQWKEFFSSQLSAFLHEHLIMMVFQQRKGDRKPGYRFGMIDGLEHLQDCFSLVYRANPCFSDKSPSAVDLDLLSAANPLHPGQMMKFLILQDQFLAISIKQR